MTLKHSKSTTLLSTRIHSRSEPFNAEFSHENRIVSQDQSPRATLRLNTAATCNPIMRSPNYSLPSHRVWLLTNVFLLAFSLCLASNIRWYRQIRHTPLESLSRSGSRIWVGTSCLMMNTCQQSQAPSDYSVDQKNRETQEGTISRYRTYPTVSIIIITPELDHDIRKISKYKAAHDFYL